MQWLNRILIAVLLAAAIAYLPRGLHHGAGTEDLARVRRERQELLHQNERLREEIRLIRAEVKALKQDPRELERIAREDLNLVQPGEIVFEVRRVGGTDSENEG